MKKLLFLLAFIFVPVFFSATSYAAAPTPTPTPGCTLLTAGFEDVTDLVPLGWFMRNNSQPGPGTTNWFQGNTADFPAQGGPNTSYIATNFNNGTGTSTLSTSTP